MVQQENAVPAAPGPSDSPLSSSHTNTFSDLLQSLGVSVAVTTYQAGYLIVLRPGAAGLNTHFRRFPRPMGMAGGPGRLALGMTREILEFRDMKAVAHQLDPQGMHDACYMPRRAHITGDIDIHEMAWANDGDLWLVNTKFSCLCTLDNSHSFVPRWRPPFVTALSDTDRCHLNGLCLRDGQPKFVTALGATDSREAWRSTKAHGGVLVDVDSGEIAVGGLSMPHSPRWHQGQLWLLESGDGSIGTVDLETGRYQPHAKVAGFTRGLSMIGQYAFVGLSQVRESATFSGIPLTDRLTQRVCGVSAVHLPSGREIGYVRFHQAVQEVFAVEILPHRFPDLLEPSDDRVGKSYALPEEALSQVVNRGDRPSGETP